jgi:hypothetical protein
MTGKSSHDRGRTVGPQTRDTARPEPQRTVMRAVEPRGTAERSAEQASRPVQPRRGPPRPRGVR